MEIKFNTTLDDLTERQFRLFARGKTYKKNRWFGVAGSFLGVGTVFLILKNYFNAGFPMWFPLLLGGIGATGYLIFYPDIIRKNIKNYLARKMKAELPGTTTYKIKDGQITCNSLNIDISFEISELLHLKEDEKFIELSFGPKGLCVIPKRAFESIEDLDIFKNTIKSGQAA